MELFAIISLGTKQVVWAGLATPEDAQRTALIAAVNGGNMRLLSGADLGRFLIDNDTTTTN